MSHDAPVQEALHCSQCGRTFAQSDLVEITGNRVCADCKPALLSRVMASGSAGALLGTLRYGGFWIRFGARFVPILILAVMFMPSVMRAASQSHKTSGALNPVYATAGMATFLLVTFLMSAAYEILMLKYRSATLGKMAFGLVVVRSKSPRLSWGVCFGRFFMWNIVTCGIPYLNSILVLVSSIMAGVDGEKRALHDRVCDTRVVFKASLV
jgi:uncharacterized RDD family membrane protein YckC